MTRLALLFSLLLSACAGLFAQNVELTVKYNSTDARYEVYALPDASNPAFIWGPSQISIVVPESTPDDGFAVTSVAGGAWNDNTQLIAPVVTPEFDYHAVGSQGAPVALTAGQETLLFHFVIPGQERVDGIRLFDNSVDPDSGEEGMLGGDFRNNIFSLAGEAYGGNYDNEPISAPAFAPNLLHQNTPNPVAEVTSIRFELAAAGSATLSLHDAAGRLVMVRQLDAVAGENRIELTAREIGATGIMTYTLTSGDFVASKKMIVVR